MSQERLAELLGITFQQVQKYEKGINRIAAGRLYAISEALDYPLVEMLEAAVAPRAKGSKSKAPTRAYPETPELVALFSKVKSAKVRHRILELVRSMVND